MVGLVIVSHSAGLAEGVRDLANTMTQGRVPIAVAGGIDDSENPFGTDAMKVVAAIEAVYSPDGVIVLMDLGSAVLSAETALDFLSPEQQMNVYLCEAPLVEGALAAAVQAGAGSTMEQVLGEARAALAAKAAQLEPLLRNAGRGTQDTESGKQKAEATIEGTERGGYPFVKPMRIVVPNALGLHARPAARLVGLIGKYSAQVTIRKGNRTINGASITQVVTLGARQGEELEFSAKGEDASAVLEAIAALAADNFGDEVTESGTQDAGRKTQSVENEQMIVGAGQGMGPPMEWNRLTRPPLGDGVIQGISAAPGIAIAPAFRLDSHTPTFTIYAINDIHAEQGRIDSAIAETIIALDSTIAATERRVGKEEAGIFVAHRLMLQDPELLGNVAHELNAEPRNAEAVWWSVIEAMAATYQQLEDPYLQARSADVLDVGRQVLRRLVGEDETKPVLTEQVIVVAQEISPSAMAELDTAWVAGIATAEGGATSHSAILSRSLGIPAVVGIGSVLKKIESGQPMALDGAKGILYLSPSEEQVSELQAGQAILQTTQNAYVDASKMPAVTTDGRRIEVAANLGSVTEATRAVASGAEGVGLFRTEFLFMERTEAPTEEEQYQAYTAVASAMNGYPVIIRTLDVGGDKPIPYLSSVQEDNPFLGHRGIRNWLDAPALARTQLRAICRASQDYKIKVMFPMVSTIEEVRRAKKVLAEVQADLAAEGIGYNRGMEVGIMIEVPAAVWSADALAREVDFFSIGTNDLTQYIMAADRGNAKVRGLATYFQPAVLLAIQQVVGAAKAADIWVGMCGEMAGDPLALPLLVGLGLDELSMSAPAIPEVKAKIRELSLQQAEAIALHTLTLPTSEVVQTYISE